MQTKTVKQGWAVTVVITTSLNDEVVIYQVPEFGSLKMLKPGISVSELPFYSSPDRLREMSKALAKAARVMDRMNAPQTNQ